MFLPHHQEPSYKLLTSAYEFRRGPFKKLESDLRLFMRRDGVLEFTHKHRWLDRGTETWQLLATMTPETVTMLHFDADKHYTNTLSNRIWDICRLRVGNDATNFRNYKQSLRVFLNHKRWWHGPSIPYVPGLIVRGGQIMNPEIAIDYKRKLNRGRALDLQRKMRPLAKLLKVSARVGAYDSETMLQLSRTMHYNDRFKLVAEHLDDPHFDDVQMLMSTVWQGYIPYRYRTAHGGDLEAMLADKTEQVVRKFREWLYEERGCYDFVVTTDALHRT